MHFAAKVYVLLLKESTSLACGEALCWNLAKCELLQEEDGEDASESLREEFGVYKEELPAKKWFLKSWRNI